MGADRSVRGPSGRNTPGSFLTALRTSSKGKLLGGPVEADLNASATTASRVRAALREGLPSGLTSMEDIAAKLLMSKRTLQRRLEAEASNFQGLLQETREAVSRHYLMKTTLPFAEISLLLGFDEPNSFYRAFRAWTGTTPDAVRRQYALGLALGC